MKKIKKIYAAIALSLFAATKSVLAFSVITDESIFLSQFDTPAELIRFDQPAPEGFTGVSYGLGEGAVAYEIRENAWSANINIGSLGVDGCCWLATTWYGSYVSPSIADRPDNWINRIYINLNASVSALSMRTSQGFIGLVPSGPTDTFFALPVDVTVSEVALGYHAVSSVPEPLSFELACAGILIFLLRGLGWRFLNFKKPSA